jgi:hypothetical protein
MESRLLKYKKKHRKSNFKVYFAVSIIILLISFTVLINKIPGTYAWFATKSTAVGTIKNASTSDLVNIKVGKIKYLDECKIKSTITIKNISNTEIPIKIKIVKPNSQEKLVTEITLNGNDEYTTDPAVINLQDEQCSNQNIGYRVIGFNGYIDELIPVQVDLLKLQASSVNSATIQVNDNNTPVLPVSVPENVQKNTPGNDISTQGSSPVISPSAEGNIDAANSQNANSESVNGNPQEGSSLGNGSASTTLVAPSNESQTQGTESAPVQP